MDHAHTDESTTSTRCLGINVENFPTNKEPTLDELCMFHYENQLLQYRLTREKLEKGDSNENRSKKVNNSINNPKLGELLYARTDFLESVQRLYHRSKEDESERCTTRKNINLETIYCLFEKTRVQLADDACTDSFLDLVNDMTDKVHSLFLDKKTIPIKEPIDDDDSLEDFFDEYPLCLRKGWDQEPMYSSSDDDEVDENNCKGKREAAALLDRKKKSKRDEEANSNNLFQSLSLNQTNTSKGICTNPYATKQFHSKPSGSKGISKSTDTENFDARSDKAYDDLMIQRDNNLTKQHQQTDTQTNADNRPYNIHTNKVPPGHSDQVNSQDNYSWDDHFKQNPFQSAREYARASGDHQKEQLQSDQSNNLRQVESLPIHLESLTIPSPLPPQPLIRDSLKRKFQVPKVGVMKMPTEKNSVVGMCGAVLKSETSAVRNSGTISRPGSSTGNKPTNQEDSDDSLPEELKRFGKDLVEKIESEIMESGDKISFDDIAGLADQKQIVQEVVCWPMKRPDLFTGLRSAPNGLLLYGPPGTGKTLIGKAIAHESGATFFSISSSSLTSKWIGEGEKLVRTLFAVAAYREPSVVFIDEIDSLLTQRKADENEASRRIKTEFLCQLDGTGTSTQGRVLLVGATNRPQELDDAARRRFTKRLYIPLPEESDREILLRVLLGKNKHELAAVDIEKLAKETKGFSGADLKALSAEAAMGPIRQLGARALEVEVTNIPSISMKHFKRALKSVRPSVAASDLEQYIKWDNAYGSKRAEDDDDDDHDESDAE